MIMRGCAHRDVRWEGEGFFLQFSVHLPIFRGIGGGLHEVVQTRRCRRAVSREEEEENRQLGASANLAQPSDRMSATLSVAFRYLNLWTISANELITRFSRRRQSELANPLRELRRNAIPVKAVDNQAMPLLVRLDRVRLQGRRLFFLLSSIFCANLFDYAKIRKGRGGLKVLALYILPN